VPNAGVQRSDCNFNGAAASGRYEWPVSGSSIRRISMRKLLAQYRKQSCHKRLAQQ
jgi:hypothetical protein